MKSRKGSVRAKSPAFPVFKTERLEPRRMLDQGTAVFTYHFFATADPNDVVLYDPILNVPDHSTVYLHAYVGTDADYGPPTGTITLHWYHGGVIGTYPLRSIPAPSNPDVFLAVIDIVPAVFNEADSGDALPSGPDKGGHLYYITYSGDGNYHPNANTGNALWQRALVESDAFGNVNQIMHFTGKAKSSAFRQGPTNSAIGGKIDPPVTVVLNKDDGSIDTAANAAVTISLNPVSSATGVLGGTLTVNAVHGVATFKDLTVDKAGDYTLTEMTTAYGSGTSGTFTVSKDKLVFSTQPIGTLAKKTMKPVVVTAVDATGTADPTDTATVTLALQAFSGSGTGTLSGTVSHPLVNGVATFDDLAITANGGYQLAATDTNTDPAGYSTKFTVGPSTSGLEFRSRSVKRKNGVVAGDHIFYSILTTPKKLVESQTITITLPTGIVPLHLTGGATAADNVITCTNARTRVITFDILIPEKDVLAGALDDDDNLTSIAIADYAFTDGSTVEATASNSVKVGINKTVKGSVRDVLTYPKANLIKTSKGIGGVNFQLIDDQQEVADTATTNGGGSFTLDAKHLGSHTVKFTLRVPYYNGQTKTLETRTLFLKKTVVFEKGDTRPIDLKDVIVPAVFFDTVSKVLTRLHTYSTESFQHLKSLAFNLFSFDTFAVESVVSGLLGTDGTPQDPLPVESLAAGGPVNQWVGAIHMLGGLGFLDSRFRDSFGFTDKMGLSFAVLVSAKFSEKVGKTLNGVTGKLFPNTSTNPALQLAAKLEAAQQKLNRTFKVATMTAFGLLFNTALDVAGVKGSDKAAINAVTFNALRYTFDLFTGQFLDDVSFEVVFNAARVAFDVAFLTTLTGVHVDELPTPFSLIGALDASAVNVGGSYNLQSQINTLAAQFTSYDNSEDPGKIFAILDKVDGYLVTIAKKASVALGGVNNLYSISRGITGVDGIITGVTKYNPTVTVSAAQQHFRTLGSSYGSLLGKLGSAGAKTLEARLLAFYFAEGAAQVLRQALYGAATADMLKVIGYPVFFDQNATAATLTGHLSDTTSLQAAPATLEPAAIAVAVPDSTTYLADLAQLAKLVKAGDEPGVTALYPQFTTDDDALFAGLTSLNDQLTAAAPQLAGRNASVADNYAAALKNALNQTYLAQYQIAIWSVAPATGQPSVVAAQINTAIAAVKAVLKQAPQAQAVLTGRTLPASLAVDVSGVPGYVAVGATVDLSITVTNVGDQTSAAGAITLVATDATLQVAGTAQQAVAALAPGQTATFTWQVTGVSPSTNAGYSEVSIDLTTDTFSIPYSYQTTVG